MIITMYVSRFSRLDPLDAVPVCTELLNLGVTIVSVTEGEFRKGSLMDLIHLLMRLDAAHSESKNKSIAVRGAHALAMELGGFIGKPGYGFKLVPETRHTPDGSPVAVQVVKHDKDEAKVIRDVWETIKQHKDEPFAPRPGEPSPGSLTDLCRRLTRDKVPTRGQTVNKRTKGSAWSPVTLKRILRDPRVGGFRCESVFATNEDGSINRRTVIGRKILRDPVTMEPLTLDCGPIIPPTEWYELQQWLDTRGRGKGRSTGAALLTAMGILRCECGAVMVGATKVNDPVRGGSYRCKRNPNKVLPGHHTGYRTVQQRPLDEYIARLIFAKIGAAAPDEDTLTLLSEVRKRYARTIEASATTMERSALLAERADAVTALNELYDDKEAGGYGGTIGRQRFLNLERKLTAQIEGSERRLAELDEQNTPRLPLEEWLGEDPDMDPLGEGSWWAAASMVDRKALVRLFVERIDVYRAENRSRWAFMGDRVKVTFAQPTRDEYTPEELFETTG